MTMVQKQCWVDDIARGRVGESHGGSRVNLEEAFHYRVVPCKRWVSDVRKLELGLNRRQAM